MIYICHHCDFLFCKGCGEKIKNLNVYNHELEILSIEVAKKEKEKNDFLKSFMNGFKEFILKCNYIITKKNDIVKWYYYKGI